MRVAQVLEAQATDAFADLLEASQDVALLKRRADLGRKDESVILPAVAREAA